MGHRFSSISDINRLIAIDYYRLRSILSIIEFRISIGHVGAFAVAIKIFFRVYQITVPISAMAKLSFPRQNFISHGKTFFSTAKFTFLRQKFQNVLPSHGKILHGQRNWGLPRCKNLTRFSLFVSFCFAVRYCLKCFCFLCFTSSVSFTGSYTEVKPETGTGFKKNQDGDGL